MPVTADLPALLDIGRMALSEARAPIARLIGSVDVQAREVLAAFDALEASYAKIAVELPRASPATRQLLVELLEHTLPRRALSIKAAALAYAGADMSDALAAALGVAVKVAVAVAKAAI